MQIINYYQENLGQRIDKFLCAQLDISFAIAQKLLREKKILVNQKKVDGAYKIKTQDQITSSEKLKIRIKIANQKPYISSHKANDFWSNIIFEDENLIAINKPSGLATQGGSGIDICVDDFVKEEKFQLVHRLDKETSGILLIAKSGEAAEMLTEKFKSHQIEKTYLALVNGLVKKDEGKIDIAIIKKGFGKDDRIVPDKEEGKTAITFFKVVKRLQDTTLLELKPITGRMHQLRVHCKEIGHPIINDVKYGTKAVLRKDLCKRLCLHAKEIVVKDYLGTELKVSSPSPEFC